MGQCIDRPLPGPPPVVHDVFWSFKVDGAVTAWGWEAGPPAIHALSRVRRPRSTSGHRHIPVLAFCATTGEVVGVESGLEYELLLGRDRDPAVSWLLPQPCRLSFRRKAGRARSHVPDLLEQRTDGSVVLWDARPKDRRDERFEEVVEVTAAACAEVGWGYEVFTGHDPALRYTLRWLAAYRASRPWHIAATAQLRRVLADGGTVSAVLEADRGGGHLVQTMWHLIWTGELVADLTEALTADTPLMWSGRVDQVGSR